jgi:hypothetical protein
MTAMPERQSRHESAVLDAEARHLVHVLAPLRVLHRDALEQLAGAHHWHQCSFERALATAVQSGAIEKLPGEFYRFAG